MHSIIFTASLKTNGFAAICWWSITEESRILSLRNKMGWIQFSLALVAAHLGSSCAYQCSPGIPARFQVKCESFGFRKVVTDVWHTWFFGDSCCNIEIGTQTGHETTCIYAYSTETLMQKLSMCAESPRRAFLKTSVGGLLTVPWAVSAINDPTASKVRRPVLKKTHVAAQSYAAMQCRYCFRKWFVFRSYLDFDFTAHAYGVGFVRSHASNLPLAAAMYHIYCR
jgi:hypothetical protein